MSRVPPPPGLVPAPPGLGHGASGLKKSPSFLQFERIESSEQQAATASLDFFRAIEIRRQLEDFYEANDPSKLNASSMDKFVRFIAQHSYEAFNAMLDKKYGSNLESRADGADLRKAIEAFYMQHDPSKLTGMRLFLEFIQANGLPAFNTMLLNKYGAALDLRAGLSREESSQEEPPEASPASSAWAPPPFAPPLAELSPEEWKTVMGKLEAFYLRRDPSKLNAASFGLFSEFICVNGLAKFNEMLMRKCV
jgi:hypothetical protein